MIEQPYQSTEMTQKPDNVEIVTDPDEIDDIIDLKLSPDEIHSEVDKLPPRLKRFKTTDTATATNAGLNSGKSAKERVIIEMTKITKTSKTATKTTIKDNIIRKITKVTEKTRTVTTQNFSN